MLVKIEFPNVDSFNTWHESMKELLGYPKTNYRASDNSLMKSKQQTTDIFTCLTNKLNTYVLVDVYDEIVDVSDLHNITNDLEALSKYESDELR